MASVFGHAAVAATAYTLLPKRLKTPKVLLLGIFCSTIPDADILAFRFGIPYEHLFGHRGITHSIFFSLLLGIVIVGLFHANKKWSGSRYYLGAYYILCTLSHALLDACTNGGRGVALWAPILNDRIFFPMRVIQVSPIGASRFFSKWGLEVLRSEFIWIGIPCMIILGMVWLIRKLK